MRINVLASISEFGWTKHLELVANSHLRKHKVKTSGSLIVTDLELSGIILTKLLSCIFNDFPSFRQLCSPMGTCEIMRLTFWVFSLSYWDYMNLSKLRPNIWTLIVCIIIVISLVENIILILFGLWELSFNMTILLNFNFGFMMLFMLGKLDVWIAFWSWIDPFALIYEALWSAKLPRIMTWVNFTRNFVSIKNEFLGGNIVEQKCYD